MRIIFGTAAVLLVGACATGAPERPAITPNAAPQVADVCVEKDFTLYFEIGETELNEDSIILVQRVAFEADACTFAAVEIEGHADTQGPSEVNRALSQDRAKAVLDELLAAGVSADRIKITAFGEERAVTKDGVNVPQNRKAIVRLVY